MSETKDYIIKLSGRIDSSNASDIEADINSQLIERGDVVPVLDFSGLEYVSSAGLRIFLKLQKKFKSMRLIEVNNDIYRIFEMTGFIDILNIQRAFRFYDKEAAQRIASGAEGVIYRVDRDTIVKVYKDASKPEEIQEKIDFAHKAFMLGIPSAIPFDVVRFGETFGAVYELIDSDTLAQMLIKNTISYDECINTYVGILKEVHGLDAPAGSFPDRKSVAVAVAEGARKELGDEATDKYIRLIEDIKDCSKVIHADLHLNNIMMQGDEALLIDLDSMSTGDYIFEFAGIHYSYQSFLPSNNAAFHKLPEKMLDDIWHDVCAGYFENDDPAFLERVTDRCVLISSIKQIDRISKGGHHDFSSKEEALMHYKSLVMDRLSRVDSLSI